MLLKDHFRLISLVVFLFLSFISFMFVLWKRLLSIYQFYFYF